MLKVVEVTEHGMDLRMVYRYFNYSCTTLLPNCSRHTNGYDMPHNQTHIWNILLTQHQVSLPRKGGLSWINRPEFKKVKLWWAPCKFQLGRKCPSTLLSLTHSMLLLVPDLRRGSRYIPTVPGWWQRTFWFGSSSWVEPLE